jgi:hypothetical protein
MGDIMNISFLLRTDGNNCTTRAISDGKSVDKLCYAIFTESGEIIIPKATKQNVSGISASNSFVMTITLPAGPKYKAVFWAQNSESLAYTVSDDMIVSVDYSLACNDDKSDAFYGVSDVFTSSDDFVEVTLRRPFAQLNVGAFPFDWEYINNFHKFDVKKSCMRVGNVAHSINLFNGELSDMGTASFKPNALPIGNLEADVD